MKHPLLCTLCLALSTMTAPALLSGCSTAPTTQSDLSTQDWQSLQTRLQQISEIELRGRLTFKTADGNMGAVFNYSKDADLTLLKITSSFGKNIATLKIMQDEATLYAQNHLFSAPTARELFAEAVGLDLPLDKLHEIIVGIAQPLSLFDADGRLVASSLPPHFTVNYQKFMQEGDIALPAEMTIQAPDSRVEIRTRQILKLELGNAE